MNLKLEEAATSEYGNGFKADKALLGGGRYYCSKKNAGLPVYWWISFTETPVEIVSIQFEEMYPGAEFEFFACDTKEFCKEGRVLINGAQKDITGKDFDNGQYYSCYGLKITKLGAHQYATLMNFRYFVLGKPNKSVWNEIHILKLPNLPSFLRFHNIFLDNNDCDSQLCSGNGFCVDHINKYSCNCSVGFTGKDCETG